MHAAVLVLLLPRAIADPVPAPSRSARWPLTPLAQVQFPDKLKCTVLYALRYESQANNLPVLRGLLRAHARMSNYAESVLDVIDRVLGFSGSHVRSWPLFARDSDALSLKNVVKTIQTNVKGIDNIYTQHKPLLHDILQHLFAGELKTQQFPFADSGNPRTCVTRCTCSARTAPRRRPWARPLVWGARSMADSARHRWHCAHCHTHDVHVREFALTRCRCFVSFLCSAASNSDVCPWPCFRILFLDAASTAA